MPGIDLGLRTWAGARADRSELAPTVMRASDGCKCPWKTRAAGWRQRAVGIMIAEQVVTPRRTDLGLADGRTSVCSERDRTRGAFGRSRSRGDPALARGSQFVVVMDADCAFFGVHGRDRVYRKAGCVVRRTHRGLVRDSSRLGPRGGGGVLLGLPGGGTPRAKHDEPCPAADCNMSETLCAE